MEKIIVVMGGTSLERGISLKSGEAMYSALKRCGYNVEPFILEEDNITELIRKNPTCVVLALHGKFGEDGKIQGLLDLVGIPYTGSGTECSAICMNKILTKRILGYEGVEMPAYSIVRKGLDLNNIIHIGDEIGFPMVAKVPREGSSFGVKIVSSNEELKQALDELFQLDDEVLIEEYMSGKELMIPVLESHGKVKTFPIIEVKTKNSFYDFEAKYTKGMSEHIIPANISEQIAEIIREVAIRSFQVLGCKGLARFDFILNSEGVPNLIEVNTLPGMTQTSLVPESAKAVGISFEKLVSDLVEAALNK